LAYLDGNTGEFWKGIGDRSRSSFIGELRDADEELFASEQHVAAFKFRFRIRDIHQRQIKFFLQNSADVLDLKIDSLIDFNRKIAGKCFIFAAAKVNDAMCGE
jgi:hypothetical protein